MKQYFIINQDRDRIYPLEKEFVHTRADIDKDGNCMGIKIFLSGLLLGICDNMKQAIRVVKMIKNFEGRNGQAFHFPGYSNYNGESDWMELLSMYQQIEAKEAALDEMA